MSKEFRYRRHIYWGQYVILIAFILLFLLMLGLGISISRTLSFRSPAIGLIALAFIFLVEGIALWYVYYRLAGVVVSVNDDELIYKSRSNEKRILLENIYLEFSSIKYTGGWLKIKAGKENIRITVVLKDISGFVQELKTKLDNKQLSSHYDSHKLFSFLKTATASDQSWERAYIMGKVLLLLFDASIAIFIGFLFGSFPFYGFLWSLGWAFISTFWIMTAYVIAEILLFRVIAKNSNESTFTVPLRDLSYEKHVFDRAFTWGASSYFIFSLFVLIILIWIKIVAY